MSERDRTESAESPSGGWKSKSGARKRSGKMAAEARSLWREVAFGTSTVGPAIGVETALRREAVAIDEKEPGTRSALAFSGGGIRSATFNLGVLQALADLGLLRRFDYLSTVSGGGYIGSWLSAMLQRFRRDPSPIDEVTRRLVTCGRPGDGDACDESHEVRFLRRYSNYLTPKIGLLTVDTWSIVAIYFRNLLLNLAVLVLAGSVVLLAPRLVVRLLQLVPVTNGSAAIAGGVALLAVAGVVLLAGYHFGGRRERFAATTWGIGLALVSGIAGYVALSVLEYPPPWPYWVVGGGLLYGLVWTVSVGLARRRDRRNNGGGWMALWAFAAGAGGGLGLFWLRAWMGSLGWSPDGQVASVAVSELDRWTSMTWGPVMVAVALTWVVGLHIGLLGRELADYRREWLSRLAALVLTACLGWLALFSLVVLGPVVIFWVEGKAELAFASGWIGTTIAGLLASRSTAEGGIKGVLRSLLLAVSPYVFVVGMVILLALGLDRGLSEWHHFQAPLNVAADEGPVTGQSRLAADPWQRLQIVHRDLNEKVAEYRARAADKLPPIELGRAPAAWRVLRDGHVVLLNDTSGSWWFLALLMGLLVALAWFAAWRFDVNEFSMHRFYRNRLVRCYLGATNSGRAGKADPFTGLAFDDDIDLTDLRSPPDSSCPPDPAVRWRREDGPYPLINTALNLVAGDELAWQERKAASFLLSPFFCGFDSARLGSAEPSYRSAEDFARFPYPMTLGSAMAISGAAASPNMGFRSSPAVTALLAVFNVRLGWWVGNTRRDEFCRRSGPREALSELFRELLGQTRGDGPYVYLSDGGHFENLGIYELVRRRCKLILSSDVGTDPKLTFEDLGNAIRKCRADFGVDIEINLDALRRPPEGGFSRWHCAVGKVRYDLKEPSESAGMLLFLKSSLTGDEPADVLNYASLSPSFPHESTGDQFFGESQFESYRRLGYHAAREVLEESVRVAEDKAARRGRSDTTLKEIFVEVAERWYPPSPETAGFSRHGEKLDQLFHLLRSDADLDFLNRQFYPEWRSLLQGEPLPPQLSEHWLPESEPGRRAGFYFCNSLFQLMENVYLDLDLDRFHDHPDNRGWMNLFRHWTWSGMFRIAWSISASTYGARFQSFVESRLDLEPGKVRVIREPGDHAFNPVEIDVIKTVTETATERVSGLEPNTALLERWAVQLFVADPMGAKEAGQKPRFEFFVGLALTEGDTLRALRIQDHLRRMGLGRRAVRRLKEQGIHRIDLLEAPAKHHALFPDEGRVRLRNLFHSVHVAGANSASGGRPPAA